MTTRNTQKTNWKDIGDLRKPNSNWRLKGASRWYANALGLPADAVVFFNPDGTRARSDKTLKALRSDWGK